MIFYKKGKRMKSQMVKLILLSFLVLQAGCDLTLKKKNKSHQMAHAEKSTKVEKESTKAGSKNKKEIKKTVTKNIAVSRDEQIIISYYSDAANKIIRKDMISHTEVSKKQAKKLKVGKIIPRDIQVMPLPIALEKRLSPLSLDRIRVQVGVRVILMDVKSRRILAIIKI